MPLQKREHGNQERINSLVETFYTHLFITTHCHIHNLQNIQNRPSWQGVRRITPSQYLASTVQVCEHIHVPPHDFEISALN